jgi:ral guanine nucleotide dissociation stimulator-like 1
MNHQSIQHYYLLKHTIDRDIQNQCRSLLNRFINEGENIFKLDDNPNSLSEVDSNNNSKYFHTDEFNYHTQMNISDLSHVILAEQLTIIDAELLKGVLPHECLTMGANGNNRRGLNSNRILSTVDKTIEQFNAVVKRVIATVLNEQHDQIRAQVMEKWIDIADECRHLKNFSSLTAILNGLLSGCIFRLKTAWSYMDLKHCAILNRLKDVFGSCTDRKEARAILDKQLDDIRLTLPEHSSEGTSKYIDATISINGTLGRKVRSKKIRDQQKIMIGTVPYLGLYLSDLTYIDSAHENYININENDKSSQKLIHFDKHRKQFEILAQIKLFQFAANAYTTLHRISNFKHWFESIPTYDEDDSWNRSFQIEPKEMTNDNNENQQQQKLQEDSSSTYRTRPLKAFPSQVSLESFAINHNQTLDSTVPSGSSLRSTPSLTSLDKISITSIHSFPQRQPSTNSSEKKIHSNHSRSSSASSFLTNASSSQGYMSAQASPANSVANCTVNLTENETLIAKVQLVGRHDLLYKKVRISNNERTPSVLKIILEKFNLDPSTYDRYCIEQQLPNKKIVLLDHSNVFYALVRQSEDDQVELIVREKTLQERQQTKTKPPFHPTTGHNRTPSGFSISSTHSR